MNAETFTQWLTAILAILVVAGVFVLLALGVPVPDAVWTAFALILGFFFGNQTGRAMSRAK
jgi:hypothetical protein